jgi:hypothetical protein
MKYTLDWIETKSADWKLASITNEAGMKFTNVSINRVSKKGETFPNFDNLRAGETIAGEYWETPDKSKSYLYPPRVEKTQGEAYKPNYTPKTGAITKAMDRKEANIEKIMDRKEDAYQISGTARDAVLCAIAEFNSYTHEDGIRPPLEFLVEKWRKYLWLNYWKEDKDFPPFE